MRRSFNMVSVAPSTYLTLAVALLILPLQWVAAWLGAVLFHEFGHVIAILLTGGSIRKVKVGWNGTAIETDVLSKRQEFVCAIAGPAASFLLLILAKILPRLAICGCIQGAYNLLPIYPLDGGRVLQVLSYKFLPDSISTKIPKWIEKGSYLLLGTACIYAAIKLSLGILPFACFLLLLFKSRLIKFPCKRGFNRIQ